MARPEFITEEEITRWDQEIKEDAAHDEELYHQLSQHPELKETCYAGLYLVEELDKLGCPDELIFRIQFTAGKMSFGKDPWDVSVLILDKYKNNELVFEDEPDQVLN